MSSQIFYYQRVKKVYVVPEKRKEKKNQCPTVNVISLKCF